VELFNEIEATGQCALEVGYLRDRDPGRRWQTPEIRHEAIVLENGGLLRARESVRRADLVVFNYYRHANAEWLIDGRDGPWCFWGERPGFHQHAWAGRLLRKWKLSKLHATPTPIWGIGKFAVDEYRKEFGSQRAYYNLPYFSDLERFRSPVREEKSERVFLFSGSLITRKGIDLLVAAFARLVREIPNVRLRIVGDGELRRVSERVTFVGFKDWHELPREYAAADLLCVPSRYDGWGLIVPEGLASGLPVIATDRMGAALEFVETGRNGWLIPAGDEEALLRVMKEAAVQPLRELREGALESVSGHTLGNGAARFFKCAQAAVENWNTD
jgi:glycosyltransferase involved in cell wall biosynthesis